MNGPRSRGAQVYVNDLCILPVQRSDAIDQGVLATLALELVLQLIRRRLPNIDAGLTTQMLGAKLIHRRAPA